MHAVSEFCFQSLGGGWLERPRYTSTEWLPLRSQEMGPGGGGVCHHFSTPLMSICRLEKKGLILDLTLLGSNLGSK